MIELLLLRHAKSSWEDDSLADFDRPLAPRGRRDAPVMGRYLRRQRLLPERVLCSSAIRTRETWALAREAMELDPPVRFTERLYHASARTLLDEIREVDSAPERLLLIGHNPGMQALALGLAGEGPERELERIRRKLPTAALVVLRFDVDDWREVEPGAGELERFVKPKELLD